MNLTRRKYRFIERFMQLSNAEKLKQLENLLYTENVNDEAVIYDIKGVGISKEEISKEMPMQSLHISKVVIRLQMN